MWWCMIWGYQYSSIPGYQTAACILKKGRQPIALLQDGAKSELPTPPAQQGQSSP